jgi:hypothetical protein
MARTSFNQQEIDAFAPSEKIGLISCINPAGRVHVALITSIMASKSDQITLGQFCTGLSKWYIQENNRVGFLIMTLDRKLWRGKARWTHKRLEGPEYERYNDMPMFRYNTYFGINTVHYLDLVETGEQEPLPMGRIVPAAMMTAVAKGAVKTGDRKRILKPFAERLFNRLDSLKFLSYIGPDGFPVIIPIIQCQAADSRRLVFSTLAYRQEIQTIPAETEVAVFCASMSMESVLVRGVYSGVERQRMLAVGTVDIDWVYNSMPPNHGQIYPETELAAVIDF